MGERGIGGEGVNSMSARKRRSSSVNQRLGRASASLKPACLARLVYDYSVWMCLLPNAGSSDLQQKAVTLAPTDIRN